MSNQKQSHLTKTQKYVTQDGGMESAFHNEYWDNHAAGIYVDLVSGTPLFLSIDKYNANTGWPSFSKPINKNSILETEDNARKTPRLKVQSVDSGSHLGRAFFDGPTDKGGMCYCMNSASLHFIPIHELQEKGYAEYLSYFDNIQHDRAFLAGGCFWGIEELFRSLEGILDAKVGYTGGTLENPTYEQVRSGSTGHAESLEILFDPTKISYTRILKFFFMIHNPTSLNKQGGDVGTQYRSAIFYLNEEQKKIAENIIKVASSSGIFSKKIVTEIVEASEFFTAEEYHQRYLQKNPKAYICHEIREQWKF